jgi:hypothetical protein
LIASDAPGFTPAFTVRHLDEQLVTLWATLGMHMTFPLFLLRNGRPILRKIGNFRAQKKFQFLQLGRPMMAVNKPVCDNARKGAVKKRSQLKTKLGGATAWTKRNKRGEFIAVKKY